MQGARWINFRRCRSTRSRSDQELFRATLRHHWLDVVRRRACCRPMARVVATRHQLDVGAAYRTMLAAHELIVGVGVRGRRHALCVPAPCSKRYIDTTERSLQRSTWVDYRRTIDSHLIPAFGDLHLSELTRAKLREWASGLDVTPRRLASILLPLRAVLMDAAADEIMDRNVLPDGAYLREHDPVGGRKSSLDRATNGSCRLGDDPPDIRAVDAWCLMLTRALEKRPLLDGVMLQNSAGLARSTQLCCPG